MALGTTNITPTLVGNTIGNSSRDVGILCIAPTINPWSVVRPGLWILNITTNKMTYIAPDGVSIDVRGTNPDTGSLKLGFNIGDFRGYNHTAVAPHLDLPLITLNYDPSTAGTIGSRGISFYLEDYNWWNTGGFYSKNAPGLTANTIYIINSADGSMMGYADISLLLKGDYVTVPVNFIVPAVGATSTWNFKVFAGAAPIAGNPPTTIFEIGEEHGAISTGSFSIHTMQNPSVAVNANNFIVSTPSGSVAAGQTLLTFGFTVVSGVGATAKAIIVDLYKNTVKIDTQTIFTKDGDIFNGGFTLLIAAAYDDNFVVQLTL